MTDDLNTLRVQYDAQRTRVERLRIRHEALADAATRAAQQAQAALDAYDVAGGRLEEIAQQLADVDPAVEREAATSKPARRTRGPEVNRKASK